MGTTLFVYGTLRFPEVIEGLLGHGLDGVAASLEGYRLHGLRARPYPGILPSPGNRVQGIAYRDVPARAVAIIDAWEDVEYRRTEVTVQGPEGPMAAHTYVWLAPELVDGDWDAEQFRRDILPAYLRRNVYGD